MKIKNEVDYVFRILLYLTKNGEGRVISSTEIAESSKISHLFSLRILKKLEQAGLLEIKKGAKGGYSLKVDPKTITLKTAIEAIEGKIIIKDCVSNPDACNLQIAGSCAVHRIFSVVERDFVEHLDKYNFQDIADGVY